MAAGPLRDFAILAGPKARLLLGSTFRPWGIEDAYNTPEMTYDGLDANFTRHRDPFVPLDPCARASFGSPPGR